jgi:hypothetical protein
VLFFGTENLYKFLRPGSAVAIPRLENRDFGVYSRRSFLSDGQSFWDDFDRWRSDYFEGKSSFGAVFSLDFNAARSEILSAHEFHVRARCTGDTSRVWDCLFLPHSPVSFGEDSCLHIHDGTNRVLHLHRAKNITANGNEIVTAGQNGIVRRLIVSADAPVICERPNKKGEKASLTPMSITVLHDGRAIVETAGGVILVFPGTVMKCQLLNCQA